MRRATLFLAVLLVLAGAGAALAQTLAPLPDLGLMDVRGRVLASAVQADGKIVIGGDFTLVNGVRRNNLARLNADGTLDASWDPMPNLDVTHLAVSADTVYVAGYFDTIGGQSRRYLAALDAVTGAALAWDPSPNRIVGALELAGSTVYVGGTFTAVGGQTRNCLAALDVSTGLATTWDPSPSGSGFPCGGVSAIAVNGSVVYVGGAFQNIGGQARFHLAALDAATGAATSWNPNPSGAPSSAPNVTELAVVGGTVYAGGQFTTVGGASRARLAALDAATGSATAWNPGPSGGMVHALVVAGGTVYVGGTFTSVGGAMRASLAALDATTGGATAWNPNPDADVRTVTVANGTVHVGGSFGRVAGETTLLFARLDAATGLHLAGFRPAAGGGGAVSSLAAQSDAKIAVAGGFRWVGKAGRARRGLLRLNADGTLDLDWNPATNGTVQALAAVGTTVYAGGSFASIGGAPRNGLAALDGATGDATLWNPNPDAAVAALAVDGGTIYAGGSFSTIGGAPRAHLAAVDLATGAATAWSPALDDSVGAVAVAGGTVYVAGGFTVVGGAIRIGLAAVDAATGGVLAWNPNPNGGVSDLAVSGSTVYAGGLFTTIGGTTRRYVAALDATTGAATAWDPAADGAVASLLVDGGTIYAGGAFSSVGGKARRRIAALDAALGSATDWNPDATGDDAAIATSVESQLAVASGLHVGGVFARLLGGDRDGLGAVSPSTGDGAAVGLTPAVLDLGEQAVATSGTARPAALVNYGSTTIAITAIDTTGDFSATDDCGAMLAPGARCTIMVTFAPTAIGPRTGAVTITTDAPGSPHVVSVGGLATGPGQLCCELSAAGCEGSVSHTRSSTHSASTLRIDLPPPSPTATGPSVKVGEIIGRNGRTVTRAISFGPATILIGEDQGQTCFIPAGDLNVNVNTHVHEFLSELFQATEVALLDHFACYKTAAAKAPKGAAPFPKFAPTSVTAADTLATRQLDLKKPLVVCNPADKNGEDPTAPAHAAHLEGYAAKLTKTVPPQAKPAKTVLGVTNPLGPLALEVKAPERVLVPSAKALGSGGAPPLGATTVDHFTCYKAKVAKAKKGEPPFPVFTKTTVTLTDQFGGPLAYDLKKPTRACLPADKNDESPGAQDHPDRLVCYAAKLAKRKPAQPKFVAQTVSTANQFGAEVVRAKKIDELCVPSLSDAGLP
jgi:hypothetical protein